MTSITIPDSVTSIGEGAFYGCDKLQSVTLGNGVTRINSCVFEGCSSLKSIVIPDGVTSIGDRAFSGSGLTSIVIPDSVTNMGIGVFKGCGSLTSITLPFVGNVLNGASNTHFGYIFGASSCYEEYVPASLKTVVITGGSNIDDNAFYCCRSLTSIVLPDSVTSIGSSSFSFCSNLTSIQFTGTTAQWNAISKDFGWNDYVPATKVVCSNGEVYL